MGMTPNIKQKVNTRSRGKEFRTKAARIFDHAAYKRRGMIEGIFGAEEAEHPSVVLQVPQKCKPEKVRAAKGNRMEY